MSPVRIYGDQGYLELAGPTQAVNTSLIMPSGTGTSGQVIQTDGAGNLSYTTPVTSNLTRETEEPSTSGTAIDFTSIPSGVRRITILLDQVSTNGTEYMLIQIGTGGTPTTTGYFSRTGQTFSTNGNPHSSTNGFSTTWGSTAGNRTGALFLHNMSGNKWICSGMHSANDGVNIGVVMVGGVVTLSGELDMVRITQTGSNTFDAGSINLILED